MALSSKRPGNQTLNLEIRVRSPEASPNMLRKHNRMCSGLLNRRMQVRALYGHQKWARSRNGDMSFANLRWRVRSPCGPPNTAERYGNHAGLISQTFRVRLSAPQPKHSRHPVMVSSSGSETGPEKIQDRSRLLKHVVISVTAARQFVALQAWV